MKYLSEYIREGIFGDNINSAIRINGVEIDDTTWKKCEEYYQKRRKKYFGTKTTVKLGDMQEEYNILYNEDDCIVARNVTDGVFSDDIYVLCPETIYMCHEASCVMYNNCAFSLNDIDGANDFDISFDWHSRIGWAWISGSYSDNWGRKMKKVGFESLRGYIPDTISKKAKDIIKKYIKS